MNKAYVYLEKKIVGIIEHEAGLMSFSYDSSWKDSGYDISNSLKRNQSFTATVAHNFFTNLLPEGSLRELICRRLQISPDNDWLLLLALGRESAGALTISEGSIDKWPEPNYKKLSNEDIVEFSTLKTVMPHVISSEATRFSLAGAQDKLAVYFDGRDYFLPINGAPTNRIFKFDNNDYRQVTSNEVFVTLLAKNIGLKVTEGSLYTKGVKPIAVFERYDRGESHGVLTRYHQEDLCQALGTSKKIKYQKEGGPSLTQALELVASVSKQPISDRQTLIHWHIFNILCGNSDGHGKNLSFFRRKEGVWLTPLYDLVCTRVYKTIERKMAMSYGGTHDPDLLDKERLEKWSQEIGVGKKYLRDEVLSIVKNIEEQLSDTEKEFNERYGQQGIVEQVRLFIVKQTARVQKLVE